MSKYSKKLEELSNKLKSYQLDPEKRDEENKEEKEYEDIIEKRAWIIPFHKNICRLCMGYMQSFRTLDNWLKCPSCGYCEEVKIPQLPKGAMNEQLTRSAKQNRKQDR